MAPTKVQSNAKKRSNLETWLDRETPHKQAALENASRHFAKKDDLTVNTLEALYGQESSFGKTRGKRGSAGAAGDFQLKKETARRLGLIVTEKNDERFDVDSASAAAAKLLRINDGIFSKKTVLTKDINSTPVADPAERKKFALAAFNAGEGRIAKAQKLAEKAGLNPTKWDNVKKYLREAGANEGQAREAEDYVEKVLDYESQFASKSQADKAVKTGPPRKVKKLEERGHWITLEGRHIFVEDK